MQHELGDGRRIEIECGKIQGLWDEEERTITIDEDLKGQEFVEVLLHEVLHAECPSLSEDAVKRTADSQTRALWNVMRRARK